MIREISESKYKKIAQKNQDALNFQKVKNRIVDRFGDWLLIANEYPYIEILENKVHGHYLIINESDNEESLSDFKKESLINLFDFLEKLEKENPESIVFFKNKNSKSIKKFHIHFILI